MEPGDAVGVPCDEDEDQAGEPASQDASDETAADRPVETDLEDWSVVRTQDGDYVATNSEHPKAPTSSSRCMAAANRNS